MGALFALTLFAVAPAPTQAAVQWNGSQYGTNCPTVGIANYTTGQGMSGCWGTSMTASAGQTINVHIFYFNSGDTKATDTTLRISAPPSGPITSYTFNGAVSSNGTSAGGAATINLTSPQTLTLNNVYWYPDQTLTSLLFPNGQPGSAFTTGGVNIGNIESAKNCIDNGRQPKCHQGYVTASFIVGNAPVNNCKITSFSANPTTVQSGGSSVLSWNTTGCQSVTIAGPGVSGGQALNGQTTTGNLTQSATYTINASSPGGSAPAQSIAVTVTPAATQNCTINSFSASPTTVSNGGSSMLNWNTTNCTGVTVTGPTGTLSTQKNGPVSTGSLTNTSVFNISAYGTNGTVSYPSVTVTVGGGTSGGDCKIDNFVASPTNVATGGSSTLVWNTTGCASVSVYGTGVSSSLHDGLIQTPALHYSTTYTLSAYGAGGIPVTQNVIVNVNTAQNCAINYFTASPSTVQSGSSSTISWGTTNCQSVSVSGLGVSSSSPSGTMPTPALTGNANYTITATNGSGAPLTQTIQVTVQNTAQCMISSFVANPSTVQAGGLSTLSWVTPNCTNTTLSGGSWSNTPIFSNSIGTQPLYQSTTYTLTATGSSGVPVSQSVTVNVNSILSNCAINSFYASPSQVVSGGSSTLYWSTTGCTNVNVTGPGVYGGAMTSFSNSLPIGPIFNTSNYTITAYGNGGSPTSQTAVVTVFNNQNNTAPYVTTSPATNITNTSATLNGFVTDGPCAMPTTGYGSQYGAPCYPPVGGYQNVNYYFAYGTSQYGLNQQTPTQYLPNGTGTITAYTNNLLPNTTYYFQAVAQNSYGTSRGTVLSFVTGGTTTAPITAITSVATNVTATSARLNGVVTGPSNLPISTYFEYGTSPSLGTQTGLQSVSTYTVTNYFDTISVVPNTTYYYRIVAISNGQTYPGATVSFTSGSNTVVTPPVVVTRVITGTGGGSSFVSLNITNQAQSYFPGDTINYVVTYQNISGVTLTNADLDVILPTGVTYRSSSQGVLTTNNTVHIVLGTLLPNQPPSTINIQAVTDINLKPANNFITTATLAFTTPGRATDSAIAYVLNSIGSQSNNLAGLALFGAGFFPNSLLGWILLIGLLLVLILIARYFYHRANADRMARVAPVTHVHYDNAPHSNYPGSNLPH